MEREEKREKRRKLNNKGFSLVELIIVIAIIAILAGVLSPQLIKYLDKSKKAADIQTAQTIATAVNAALADEKAYNAAASTKVSDCYAVSGTNAFQDEIKSIVGSTTPVPKYKPSDHKDFYIEVNASDKSFKIYAGTTANVDGILYPEIGKDYK
jgi:type IV pilus assembly protein PilA